MPTEVDDPPTFEHLDADLPPSSLFVLHVLVEHGEMTQADLVFMTGMAARTVRYGLDRLRDADLIVCRPRPADARQTLYRPDDGVT